MLQVICRKGVQLELVPTGIGKCSSTTGNKEVSWRGCWGIRAVLRQKGSKVISRGQADKSCIKNVSGGEMRKLTAYFLLALSMTWAEMTSAVNVGFLVGDVFSTVKTETKNRGNDC